MQAGVERSIHALLHSVPQTKPLTPCGLPAPRSKAIELAALPDVSPEQRKRMLNFVICGGGPTGVETAAELMDLVSEDIAHHMPQIKVRCRWRWLGSMCGPGWRGVRCGGWGCGVADSVRTNGVLLDAPRPLPVRAAPPRLLGHPPPLRSFRPGRGCSPPAGGRHGQPAVLV